MTVRVYRSTDTSAPVLSGTAGALIGVLDGCLVTGYGAQVNSGWTKPFTGTNLASYRQGTGSNQFYLKVRDDAPGAGGAIEARFRGFEVMTTVTATDTAADGTNIFPTIAQSTATQTAVRKSATADTTARPWIVVADARTFYLFILTGDTVGTYYSVVFGEFFSFKTSDPGRCIFSARPAENTSASTNDPDRMISLSNIIAGGGLSLSFMVRDHTGLPGSVPCSLMGRADTSVVSSSAPMAMNGTLAYTNQPDHKNYLAPIRIHNASGTNTNIRGKLRGIWHWQHPINTVADGETFTGSGNLAGKTFMVIKQTPNLGVWIVETSDTWDTN